VPTQRCYEEDDSSEVGEGLVPTQRKYNKQTTAPARFDGVGAVVNQMGWKVEQQN
jgi:hypothetical protein